VQRGLEGRRIAVYARDAAAPIRQALAAAGAEVDVLSADANRAEPDWHGAKYAALVVAGRADDPKPLQLIREFLLSGKPIAVFGEGHAALAQAGGLPEDVVVADRGTDASAFATRLVQQLSERLEERQVDEMSEQSFPASDPPSTSPSSAGAKESDGDRNARQ
jgi:putative intracellular protease/amidase